MHYQQPSELAVAIERLARRVTEARAAAALGLAATIVHGDQTVTAERLIQLLALVSPAQLTNAAAQACELSGTEGAARTAAYLHQAQLILAGEG